ncbi:MAG: DUF4038 domain-containing protein [Bryobacteraceae bacterium]|nr:DUF4038 domain-containing protein [Bryobacteraceae bacterium]
MPRRWPVLALLSLTAWGQTPCPPTPAYSPCDIVFELNEEEARAHPNPYVSVQLEAEFRSPRFRTLRMPGFWDGGRRMVIRFAPTEAGTWDFRVSSNVRRWDRSTGQIQATASNSPGFVRPRNVHHWGYSDSNDPHLWMGDTCYRFAFVPEEIFEKLITVRAAQKFNHIRGLVIGSEEDAAAVFPSPDHPNVEHFQKLDRRILAMNRKGIVADLILAGDRNHLAKLFPSWQQRERYIRYLVARYAPMHITWQGVQEFEEYDRGRELLKEIGSLLQKLDPYDHPRSTHTLATSSPLYRDGWMTHIVHRSSDDQLGAIEHQLYPVPFVNVELGYEDSGAGRSDPHHVDTDTFRRRLWNATMNGQYPTFGNTGTYGGSRLAVDPKYLESPGARQMTIWYDFFSKTRYWELEPYFDVDGGRAVALVRPRGEEAEGIEYVVYVEKPGPVELLVERHSYSVVWFNPITGESFKQKDFKGTRFTGHPPNSAHDWVLHLFREGRKRSLQAYYFESRPIVMQEPELNPKNVPYEIVEPAEEILPVAVPVKYAARITRQTRATRSMMWLWTGEVTEGGQGFRVLATGQEGQMRIPPALAARYPAVFNLRLAAMNANGKIYILDRVYKLADTAPVPSGISSR